MKYLDGWVFIYSDTNKRWRAAKREDFKELYNNFNSDKVIMADTFETLRAILIKIKGNISHPLIQGVK